MLYDWMKSLVFYLLLLGICMHLLPSDKYRQYMRWFAGLVVIVLLTNPIRFLFQLGSGDMEEILSEIESEMNLTDDASDLSVYDYYDMSLRESLKQELCDYGAEDVSLVTDADGNVLQCIVYVSSETVSGVSEEKIKNYISDVYNFDDARIYVISR